MSPPLCYAAALHVTGYLSELEGFRVSHDKECNRMREEYDRKMSECRQLLNTNQQEFQAALATKNTFEAALSNYQSIFILPHFMFCAGLCVHRPFRFRGYCVAACSSNDYVAVTATACS